MSEYVPTTDDMIECVCGEGAVGYERAEFNRFVASVKAEALREAAGDVHQIDGRQDDAAADWLRARADQIEETAE